MLEASAVINMFTPSPGQIWIQPVQISVFTLKYFSANLLSRLISDYIAEKDPYHSPTSTFFFFFAKKCSPLRPAVAMYLDNKV